MRRLLVLACCVWPATATAADPEFSTSVTPEAFSSAAPVEFTYRLHMRAGPEAESFWVGFDSPTWPAPDPGGTPVQFVSMELEGDGGLAGSASTSGSFPGGYCFRGGDPSGTSGTRVELPPDANSALVVRYRTSAPPLLGTDYAMRFLVPAGGPGSIERDVTIPTPRPARSGPTGLFIRLASRAPDAGQPSVLNIRGSTSPPVAAMPIRMVYDFGRDTDRVRTNAAGRFIVRGVRVPAARWQVQAFSRARPPGLLADKSCPYGRF